MLRANSPASPIAYARLASFGALTLSRLELLSESPSFSRMIATGPLLQTDTLRGPLSASCARLTMAINCHRNSSHWQGVLLGTRPARLYTVELRIPTRLRQTK